MMNLSPTFPLVRFLSATPGARPPQRADRTALVMFAQRQNHAQLRTETQHECKAGMGREQSHAQCALRRSRVHCAGLCAALECQCD